MAHSTSALIPNAPVTTSTVQPAYIQGVPDDVTVLFFQCLGLQDLEICGLTCRHWNQLLGLDSVWRKLVESQFETRTITLGIGETYQSAYRKQHRLIRNLPNFRFRGSSQVSLDCRTLAIADGKLIVANTDSGYFYTNIKVFDADSLKPLRSFRTHLPPVLRMSAGSGKIHFLVDNLLQKKIVTADLNSVLTPGGKIEFLETPVDGRTSMIANDNEKIYVTLLGKSKIYLLESVQKGISLRPQILFGPVESMTIADGRLYAGDMQGKIEIWSLAKNERIGSLKAHESGIHAIAVCGNYFISTDSNEYKLWNVDSHKCISSLKLREYGGAWPSVAFSGVKLFFTLFYQNQPNARPGFGIMDFTADHNTILKQIANGLEAKPTTVNPRDSYRLAFERLSKLPEHTQKKIKDAYREYVQKYFGRTINSPDFFQEVLPEEYLCNPSYVAQAIRIVLAATKSLEHPRETERKNESINNPNKGQ